MYDSIKGTKISPEEGKAMEASVCLFADMDYYTKYAGFENNFAALATELIENGYNGSDVLEDSGASGNTWNTTYQKPARISKAGALKSILMTGEGESVNRGSAPFGHVFDPFYWLINVARKNKKTVGVGMAVLAIGGAGYVVDNAYKNNKDVSNYVDNAVAKVKSTFGINAQTVIASEIAIQALAETASAASKSAYIPANATKVTKKAAALMNVSADNVSVAPTSAVTPANGSAVKEPSAPEKYFLMYDGIKIIGDKPFIKDAVMLLDFGKEYYPEGKLKYTKEIKASNATREMNAGEGHTFVNASSFHNWIEKKLYGVVLGELTHEDFHNYASLNDPKNNTEKNAGLYRSSTWNNLTPVSKSSITKFEGGFDFSKYEKEIKPI